MDIDAFSKFFDRFGWPGILILGMIVVGRWLRPRFERWFDAQTELCATLAKNDDKHLSAINAVATSGAEGHLRTHSKLDELHGKVHDIHLQVVPRHPSDHKTA